MHNFLIFAIKLRHFKENTIVFICYEHSNLTAGIGKREIKKSLEELNLDSIFLQLLREVVPIMISYACVGVFSAVIELISIVISAAYVAQISRCQFHQHFTQNFFVQKCFKQLFSRYFLAL